MKTWLIYTVLAVFALLAMMTITMQAAELKIGTVAPDFELSGSNGKKYKLSDFRGKKAVVIAWFPKSFTGG